MSKMDQIRKFGEQTSPILEFKPEGLEGYGKIGQTHNDRVYYIQLVVYIKVHVT